MNLITRAVAPTSARPAEQQRVLRAERRQFLKRRWRGLAEDGTDFGFDLAERLAHGNVILALPEADYVIHQIPEAVLEVIFGEPRPTALVAWKLGNLHQPVQVRVDRLWVADDPSVRRMLELEGIPFTARVEIFNPLRVAEHAGV